MHGYSIHCCPSKLREFIRACFVERRFCRVFVPFIRAVAIFPWGFQQVPIGPVIKRQKLTDLITQRSIASSKEWKGFLQSKETMNRLLTLQFLAD